MIESAPNRSREHDVSTAALQTALELAIRAPSLHNSQPWLWRVGGGQARLYVDESRRLPSTDPNDRELVISCGAVLHHLLVALADQGYAARVCRFPEPLHPTLLAVVTLTDREPDSDLADLAEAIPDRRTDRRPFSPWPVPSDFIGKVREIASTEGMWLQPILDPDHRWRLYRAIASAVQAQAEDPAQAAELVAWSDRPADAVDGVPSTHAPSGVRIAGQPPMRAFPGSGQPHPHARPEPESCALLLLSTSGDSQLHWLRAGELMSRILLTATRDGLASSALTQPVEVPTTRNFLREHIAQSPSRYPQALLRIGWLPADVPPLPPTPRRAVSDVLAPLRDWTEM